MIEGDNLLVINVINGTWDAPWHIQMVIRNIQLLLQRFPSYQIAHVFREVNRATEWVANVGHLVPSTFTIDLCNAPALSRILVTDALGQEFPSNGGSSDTFFILSIYKNLY